MSTPPTGAQTGRQATGGGMGAMPTPANNSDTYLGRSEYEPTGPSEDVSRNELPETGYFPSLAAQKQAGEQEYEREAGIAANEREDHSFVNRKPGHKGLIGQWTDK